MVEFLYFYNNEIEARLAFNNFIEIIKDRGIQENIECILIDVCDVPKENRFRIYLKTSEYSIKHYKILDDLNLKSSRRNYGDYSNIIRKYSVDRFGDNSEYEKLFLK